jgi:hypothetical protein
MYVQKNSKTPRFEVDYKTRLEQQRTATNAVRLPRLGFRQYRVYDIVKKNDNYSLNGQYGQHVGQGIRPVPITTAGGSSLQYNFSQVWSILLDELHDPSYKVKWLKSKQVTFLRLKGHRVEEVE